MKITSVELHPDGSPENLVLSFRDPRSVNPFNAKSIDGLDADEIIYKYYGTNQAGTDNLYALSLVKRNLVFKIGLNPSFVIAQTYSSLRDKIYKMIASSRRGKIYVYLKDNDTTLVEIACHITKVETEHFSKDQEVQLTLSCDNPLLQSPIESNFDITGLDVADTILTDSVSTAPHGFALAFTVISLVPTLVISSDNSRFEITPSGGFLADDEIHISSRPDNKYAYILRGVDNISVVDKIIPGSTWPVLFPGDNLFALDDPTHFSWLSISHYPSYWGV